MTSYRDPTPPELMRPRPKRWTLTLFLGELLPGWLLLMAICGAVGVLAFEGTDQPSPAAVNLGIWSLLIALASACGAVIALVCRLTVALLRRQARRLLMQDYLDQLTPPALTSDWRLIQEREVARWSYGGDQHDSQRDSQRDSQQTPLDARDPTKLPTQPRGQSLAALDPQRPTPRIPARSRTTKKA